MGPSPYDGSHEPLPGKRHLRGVYIRLPAKHGPSVHSASSSEAQQVRKVMGSTLAGRRV